MKHKKKQQIVKIKTPTPHSKEQAQIMNAFNTPGLQELWVACGSKFGKALTLSSRIVTNDGVKLFGDLRIGDIIFDENGNKCNVIFQTPIMYDHEVYEIVFSDGSILKADAEHLWLTTTHAERKNIARAKNTNDRVKSTNSKPNIRTTKEILDTLYVTHGRKQRPNHGIPVCGPIDLPEKRLLVDPYLLGVWLGDGSTGTGRMTNPDEEVMQAFIDKGYDISRARIDYEWYVLGFITDLKKIGAERKDLPKEYLYGSKRQRLALLQGLMDSDGR